jgi:hypothetical protein
MDEWESWNVVAFKNCEIKKKTKYENDRIEKVESLKYEED